MSSNSGRSSDADPVRPSVKPMADFSPAIRSDGLPAKYEAAKVALAECIRVDECKDWADKAAALAIYGRQSKNKELEIHAMQIRLRAYRRCGELLKEIKKATGAHLKSIVKDTLSRKGAASNAGLSKSHATTAIRVANVKSESFERQVESRDPPTVAAMAKQGKAKAIPMYEKLGMTEVQFKAGMHFRGTVRRYIEDMESHEIANIAGGCDADDRKQLKTDLGNIEKYNARLKSHL